MENQNDTHENIYFILAVIDFAAILILFFSIFNYGPVGYIGLSLLFITYLLTLVFNGILIHRGIKKNSKMSKVLGLAFISSMWVIYGIISQFTTKGLNFSIINSFLFIALLVNLYSYYKINL